jgi:hypothetical protein
LMMLFQASNEIRIWFRMKRRKGYGLCWERDWGKTMENTVVWSLSYFIQFLAL